MPFRDVPPDLQAKREHWAKWARYYDWLHILFGGGSAILAAFAASLAKFYPMTVVYLAAFAALFAFINTAIGFGGRSSRHQSAFHVLDRGFALYVSDPARTDQWLGEQHAKAIDAVAGGPGSS